MDPFQDLETTSQFDMSFNTLGRINYWLWRANIAQEKNNVHDWFQTIKIIYKESDPYMKPTDRTLQIKYYARITASYRRYLNYEATYNSSPRKGAWQPPRQIFEDLFEWELSLRRFLERKGILMRKSDDATSAMLA